MERKGEDPWQRKGEDPWWSGRGPERERPQGHSITAGEEGGRDDGWTDEEWKEWEGKHADHGGRAHTKEGAGVQ